MVLNVNVEFTSSVCLCLIFRDKYFKWSKGVVVAIALNYVKSSSKFNTAKVNSVPINLFTQGKIIISHSLNTGKMTGEIRWPTVNG